MTIWEPLHTISENHKKHVWKKNNHTQAVSQSQKSNKCVQLFVTSKEDVVLFVSIVFLILFLFSHLPTTLSLPQGRLIKTNAIVGYHCYAGAQRAAGSYFSFSLVWWCDFVFFRNRFVSNGSVYLSSLSPFPYSLCARVRMECFGLHCHITESLADFRDSPNRENFTSHTWLFLDTMNVQAHIKIQWQMCVYNELTCDRGWNKTIIKRDLNVTHSPGFLSIFTSSHFCWCQHSMSVD